MERIENYSGRAKCIRCEEKIVGAAYAGTVPVSMDKTRYLCESCHDTVASVDDARADASGATTDGYTYSITLTPKVDNEKIRFSLLDKKTGGWYLTGEGQYTSPTFCNLKWIRKFQRLAEFCPEGELTALVQKEGAGSHTVNFSWSDPSGLEDLNASVFKGR